MKIPTVIFFSLLITWLPTWADEGVFWLGASKSMLKQQSLEVPRSLWSAMSAFVGPFGKSARIILIRDGKCFVINGAKDLDVVRDFPILKGDRVQKYDESDLKAWALPVVEGAEAVALLVASQRGKLSEQGAPPADLQQSGTGIPASPVVSQDPAPLSLGAERVPALSAPRTASPPIVESAPSPTWSVVVVTALAVIGLLWLAIKRRAK